MPETEGLPLLGVDRVDTVDNERVNDFSFKNARVDTLTPLTDGDTPPPPSDLPDYPTHPCTICGKDEPILSPDGSKYLCLCGQVYEGVKAND